MRKPVVLVHDEELAAVGVGSGIRHRQRAAFVLAWSIELVAEAVTRPAAPGPGWITALQHESGDDPVEDHFVVVPLAGEEEEVVDCQRRFCGEEFDGDVAECRMQCRVVDTVEVDREIWGRVELHGTEPFGSSERRRIALTVSLNGASRRITRVSADYQMTKSSYAPCGA